MASLVNLYMHLMRKSPIVADSRDRPVDGVLLGLIGLRDMILGPVVFQTPAHLLERAVEPALKEYLRWTGTPWSG